MSASSISQKIRYIFSAWPKIKDYLPEKTTPFEYGFNRGNGLCSHPDVIDEFWWHSQGGKKFAVDSLPDSLFCVGLQNRGCGEYLFLLWVREGRKFWFYDQYFNSYSGSSIDLTRDKLDGVFKRWETTENDVIFSGPWGWFEPETSSFVKDGTENLIDVINIDLSNFGLE